LKAVVLGPTGVVGDAIIREALGDSRISSVVAVSRRPLAHVHPKLQTAILQDFTDFEALRPALTRADSVLCALGISWYQTSGQAQYRLITHDYVMACARVAAVANPSMHFCFVSGHGASDNASHAWARIKGETEQDLRAVFGSRGLPSRQECRVTCGVFVAQSVSCLGEGGQMCPGFFFSPDKYSAGVSTRIPYRSAARKWRRLSVTITVAFVARATSAMCAS
jgi:hypothetical protein